MGGQVKGRARCPCFRARVDWRGGSLIQCGGHYYRFVNGAARESQYRTRCCGDYRRCGIYGKGETTDDNAGGDEGRGGADPGGL